MVHLVAEHSRDGGRERWALKEKNGLIIGRKQVSIRKMYELRFPHKSKAQKIANF